MTECPRHSPAAAASRPRAGIRFGLAGVLLVAAATPLAQDAADVAGLELARQQLVEAEAEGPVAHSAALNDLAAAQSRLGDSAAAEESYRRSLALVEASQGMASPLLIAPLAGLAAVSAATGRDAHAVEFLRRAISVGRRVHGLFDPVQLPLIERLIRSYEALGDRLNVLAERQYALTIAEQNFGAEDPRTLPPLRELARLHESLGQHEQARGLFARMQRIGEAEAARGNAIVVEALLGLGRSHRGQFIDSPTSLYQDWVRDPVTGHRVPVMTLEPYASPKPSREGPRATARALAMLRAADVPPPRLLAEALMDMGDWHVVLGRSDDAIAYYAEAWALHDGLLPGQPSPLSAPRLVRYRAPEASRRTAKSLPGEVDVQSARFLLTVDAEGLPRDIALLESGTTPWRQEALKRSLEIARYSPRIEQGLPVATEGVEFEGHWEVLATEPEGAAAETAGSAGH